MMNEDLGIKFIYDINYQWWCMKCQGWHYSPYCPLDRGLGFFPETGVGNFDSNETYEICPHCGQMIKK